MAEKLSFDLVSPERLLLSEDVDMVVVPGVEGDMGIMGGHAPVMSTLRPGVIDVDVQGQPQRRYFVRGGFAEVTPAGLTIRLRISARRRSTARSNMPAKTWRTPRPTPSVRRRRRSSTI